MKASGTTYYYSPKNKYQKIDFVNLLMKDLRIPKFVDDLVDLKDLVFYQGTHFVEKPTYSKDE